MNLKKKLKKLGVSDLPVLRTEEENLLLLENSGLFLRIIPNQTKKICLRAVRKNAYALQFVHKQTKKICLAAVQKDKDAAKFINPELLKDK